MPANAGAGVIIQAAEHLAAALLFLLLGSSTGIGRRAAGHHKGDAAAHAVLAARHPATAVGHTATVTAAVVIAAAVFGALAGHITAGTILRKLVQLCQTLGVVTRILNHTEQNLALGHITQVAGQILIIVAHLHLVIDGHLNGLAETLRLLNANLAHAETFAGQLSQNLLQEGIMAAFIQAETAEHLFIDLTLGLLHHTAVEQLSLSGPHHHIIKNILHSQIAALTLAIVIKRLILAHTQFSGHNYGPPFSLYGVFILHFMAVWWVGACPPPRTDKNKTCSMSSAVMTQAGFFLIL